MVSRRLLLRMINKLLAMALDTWRVHVCEQRVLFLKGKRVIFRMQNMLVATAMHSWTKNIAENKRLAASARKIVLKMVNLLLTRGLKAWQANTAKILLLKNSAVHLIRHMQNRSLACAWSAWCYNASESRRLRLVALKIVFRMQGTAVAAALNKWQDICKAQKHGQALCKKVAIRIMKGPLVAALCAWISHHSELWRLKNSACRVLLRMQRLSQSRALGSWKANIEERSRLLVAARKVATRLLDSVRVSAFSGWREQASEQSRLFMIARRVVARMTNRTLWHCFSSWLAGAVRNCHLRKAAVKVALRYARSLLKRFLHSWLKNLKDNVLKNRLLMKTANRISNLSLAAAASAWRSFTIAAQQRCQICRKILKRWMYMQLASALDSWVDQHATTVADAKTESLVSELDALRTAQKAHAAALAAAGLSNPAVLAGLLDVLRGQESLQPVIITQLLRKASTRPRGFLHALSLLADAMAAQPPHVTPADLCSLLEAARAAPEPVRPTAAALVDIVRIACAPPVPLLPEEVSGCRVQHGVKGKPLPPRVRLLSTVNPSSGIKLSLETQVKGALVYYTTDLTEPGPHSQLNAGSKASSRSSGAAAIVSVELVRTTTLCAVCIEGTSRSQTISFEVVFPSGTAQGFDSTASRPPTRAAALPTQPVKGGVGMLIARSSGGHVVVKTLTEGGAAARASCSVGIGDVLVSVDGKDIRGLGTDSIAQLITGPEGSKVELTLLRAVSALQDNADGTASVVPGRSQADSVYHVCLTRTVSGFINGRPSASSYAHMQQGKYQPATDKIGEGLVLPDPAALAAAAASGSLEELYRFRDWLAQAGWPSVTAGSAGSDGWDEDDEMIV